MSVWSLASSGLVQGSVLGPAECTVTMFVKISLGEINTAGGRVGIQRCLGWLHEWARQTLTKFNSDTH